MSVKSAVRPLLPPTSRALEAHMDELHKSQEASQVAMNELQSRLEAVKLCQQEQSEQLAHLSRFVTPYVNLEYLAKFNGPYAPRILLAGWYGAENLGDELMMQAVLQHIPAERLGEVAVLLWDNWTYPAVGLDERVTRLHYPKSTWELEQLATHFDVLVWGGGAIIDERQYTPDPANTNTGNLFIRLSRMMLARGKRVWCLGLSSNDRIESVEYARELAFVVRGAEHFSLRDPYSADALATAGVPRKKLLPCEDLVFGNKELQRLLTTPHALRPATDPTRIGVVLLCLPELRGYYLDILRAIARALDASATGSDYEIALIPFLNEGESDTHYYHELLAELGNERFHAVPYRANLAELGLDAYDLIVSFKHHSSLIAYAQGVRAITVYQTGHPHYKNKMTHLAELFGTEEWLFSSDDFAREAEQAITKVLAADALPHPRADLLEQTSAYLDEQCKGIMSAVRNN